MKKGLLMGLAVVASVATLTGCNMANTKTLKCTSTASNDGFNNEVTKTFTFKNNKITKLEDKSVVKLSGDNTQYFNDYKSSAEKTVEQFKSVTGATAKVSTNNSSEITITVDYNADKMSESERQTYSLNESIESTQDKLTKEGYTCK